MTHKAKRGFTLVEILIGLAVIAILAGVSLPVLANMLESTALKAERAKCAMLGGAIRDGWQQGSAYDVSTWTAADATAAIGGTGASAYSYGSTVFDAGLVASNGAVTAVSNLTTYHWSVKVARALGYQVPFDPSGYAYVVKNGAAYVYPSASYTGKAGEEGLAGAVLFNRVGRRRVLMAGPPEQNHQRFLLLSFMAAEDVGTTLPTFTTAAEYTAYFNWLWDVDTSASNASILPSSTPNASVNTALNAVSASWNATNNGRTYLARLVKERIVQRKFGLVVKIPSTATSTVIPVVGGYDHALSSGVPTPAANPTVGFPAFKTPNYGVPVGTYWGTAGSIISGATTLVTGDRVPEGRKVWIVMGTTASDLADPTASGTNFSRVTGTQTSYTMVADVVHEWY